MRLSRHNESSKFQQSEPTLLALGGVKFGYELAAWSLRRPTLRSILTSIGRQVPLPGAASNQADVHNDA